MAGQPAYFNTPDELNKAIEEYFTYVKGESHIEVMDGLPVEIWDRKPEPVTITGLALHLGFESRQSLYDYGKREGYSYTIKRAQLRVENSYEKRLDYDKPTGAIFALKNMGWNDSINTVNQNTNLNGELDADQVKQIIIAPVEVNLPTDENKVDTAREIKPQ